MKAASTPKTSQRQSMSWSASVVPNQMKRGIAKQVDKRARSAADPLVKATKKG